VKKLFKLENNRRRRGISLVETVVALTIITLISAATVGLTLSSVRTETKAWDETVIYNHAESAVECFRYAEGQGELAPMETLLGRLDNGYKKTDNGYVLEKSNYTITVTADFDASMLTFSAVSSDGEVIYEFTYDRGVIK
jgi:type II secretory pathway pseudopilin PulG